MFGIKSKNPVHTAIANQVGMALHATRVHAIQILAKMLDYAQFKMLRIIAIAQLVIGEINVNTVLVSLILLLIQPSRRDVLQLQMVCVRCTRYRHDTLTGYVTVTMAMDQKHVT